MAGATMTGCLRRGTLLAFAISSGLHMAREGEIYAATINVARTRDAQTLDHVHPAGYRALLARVLALVPVGWHPASSGETAAHDKDAAVRHGHRRCRRWIQFDDDDAGENAHATPTAHPRHHLKLMDVEAAGNGHA